ncbi:unnamed protein product [Zymoseptoria tritici ST99CH_1E4]|uniref:Uncharacterized protein n=1 Tax=Zymoseptoria tritici ST99CH_1E4 TaxID=1276532 RepID=A0A2H1H9Q0_ZYMTR|nr:unnamed protein product [Zymoseptoria tritici ST99CH_1E4]
MEIDRPTTPDPDHRPGTPVTPRTLKSAREISDQIRGKMQELENRSASQSPVKKKTKEKTKEKTKDHGLIGHQPSSPGLGRRHSPMQYNPYDPPQQKPPQHNPPQQNPPQHHPPQRNLPQHHPPQPSHLQHHPPPSNLPREDSPETDCDVCQEQLWLWLKGLRWLGLWIWGAICKMASFGRTQCIKVWKIACEPEWKKAWKDVRETIRKKDAVKECAAPTEQVKPPVVKEEKKKTGKSSRKLPHPAPKTPHSPLRDTPLQDQKSDSHVPPTRQRSSSSSGYHGCSCCHIAIFGIISIAITFLVAFCRRSTPLTHQPINVLITAAYPISSALELLTDTMQWQVRAKLAACEFVELTANVSRNPFQYPRFRKAREKDGSGWACPVPVSPPRVNTVNENLAIMGLALAEGMWNISLLLDRSSSESLVAAQQAIFFRPKLFFPLLPCLAMPDPTFATLNDQIAHLNSILTSFAASHISLLTDLGNTATICQTHLARLVKVPLTRDRRKALADLAEMVCNLFAKDVERGLSSLRSEKERDRMRAIRNTSKKALPPFLEANRLLDEALNVLQSITASGWELRERASTTTTGDITAAGPKKKQQQQRRCRVLGALGSPELKDYDHDRRDDKTATLQQTFRKMEESARRAGTLERLEDMRKP